MPSRRRLIVYRRDDSSWDWKVIDGQNGKTVYSSLQGFTERNDAAEAARREQPDLLVEYEPEA